MDGRKRVPREALFLQAPVVALNCFRPKMGKWEAINISKFFFLLVV